MKKWLGLLLGAFYRRPCLQCRAWGFELVCQPCWRTRITAPENLRLPGLDSAWAFYAYDGVIRNLLKALKYRGCVEVIPWLLATKELSNGFKTGGPYLVVPVPLHPERLRSRGFNQALRLARVVARRHRWPCVDVLRRVRATPPLHGLSRAARLVAMRGAIRCNVSVQGRRILLVDDVVTSGATARECARALRDEGATAVYLLAAAATPETQNYQSAGALESHGDPYWV